MIKQIEKKGDKSNLVGNSILNIKRKKYWNARTKCKNMVLFELASSKCEFKRNGILKMPVPA